MPTPEVEEFAEKLMTLVRDLSIQACDRAAGPEGKTFKAMRWRAAAAMGREEHARAIIPDCVDATIFYLLHAIDNGMGLFYRTSNGRVVDLEVGGYGKWPAGTAGRRAGRRNIRKSGIP